MPTTPKTAKPELPPVLGQSPSIKAVLKAINTVMQEVGYVEKTRSAKLPYSFASEAGLIHALRPEMVKAGLVMWVSKVETDVDERYTTKNNAVMSRAKVTATLRIAHVTSGEWIEIASQGEGADSGDKATPKALTGFFKYALRQTFLIETGDDPDFANSEEQERATGKPEKAAGNGDESQGFAGNEAIKQYAELLKSARDAGVKLPDSLILDFGTPIPIEKLRDHYQKIFDLVEKEKAKA